MSYLTKDKSNLIQLWNNKPSYDSSNGIFYAWKKGKEGIINEIAMDVSDNEQFSSLFMFLTPPRCLRLTNIDFDESSVL